MDFRASKNMTVCLILVLNSKCPIKNGTEFLLGAAITQFMTISDHF